MKGIETAWCLNCGVRLWTQTSIKRERCIRCEKRIWPDTRRQVLADREATHCVAAQTKSDQ